MNDDAKVAAQPEVDSDESFPLEFHFLKSNYFRVIHIDGAFGGASLDGGIQMVLFSERLPIPDLVVHQVSDAGLVGPEIRESRVTRNGIVREAEVLAVMNLRSAKALRAWLDDKITYLETNET
jgi:hypothetical protein